MAITDRKITTYIENIKDLADRPNENGMSAEQLKAFFDGRTDREIKEKLNGLVDDLVTLDLANMPHSTDIKAFRINADNVIEITYDNVAWEATGSSGHVILDNLGNALPQRSRLKFSGGTTVTDEGAVTIISGVKGDKGDKGDIGDQGIQGIQGIKGDTGNSIIPSVDQDTGLMSFVEGQSGVVPASVNVRGPQGAQGTQGLQGITGETGSQGSQGIKGDVGAQGTIGLTGPQGAQGDRGLTGVTGSQGIKGDTGSQGPIGLTGIQGIKGATGDVGSQGPRGFVGANGAQGEQGFQGLTGTQGIKGDTGSEGPRGLTGNQGIKGDTGNTGAQGIQGVAGIQGIQGLKGDAGIQGPQGDIGARGLKGDTGDKGDKGDTGLTGAQGSPGLQGPHGPQGLKGNNGADGTSFAIKGIYPTLLALQTAHPTGSTGDAYAVGTQEINVIYNWSISTNQWFNLGALQGPQGAQGIQGIQGIKGDTGEQGLTGQTGAKGDQGIQGITGKGYYPQGSWTIGKPYVNNTAQIDTSESLGSSYFCKVSHTSTAGNAPPNATYWGLMATKGATGNTGLQGETGSQGIQGIQGIPGVKGDTGVQGERGLQGLKGDTGLQGLTGAKGDTGGQGIQGVKGDTGEQGIQGIPGDKGNKGDTGEQGIQGLTGNTGEQGVQGIQGVQGEAGPNSVGITTDTVLTGLLKGAGGKVAAATKADITALGIPAQDTVYTHPTTAGNKHLPTGGTVGQILKNTASGTATWQAESVTPIANNLTTTVAGKALDATQGKALNDLVSNKPTMTTANLTYYVATTGSDSNDGLTVGSPLRNIQTAINKIPQTVNHAVIVNVASGTYAENVSLIGFLGKHGIQINGGTDITTAENFIINNITISQCTCGIAVLGFKAVNSSGISFEIYGCVNVLLQYCTSISTTSGMGAYATTSFAKVFNCLFSNKGYAVVAKEGAAVYSASNYAGVSNAVGLYAEGAATIGKIGTQPQGATAESSVAGGVIR